jgi:predicted transcriptional regulator
MMLSVHPRHVANILDGSKTVELRRTRPVVKPGQPVAIYATSPSAALVATCRIAEIEVGAPDTIWRSVGKLTQVTSAEFDDYFDGAETAVALHLDQVTRLVNEIALSHMRSQSRFHPPQTWHFFDLHRLTQLVGRHPSSPALTELLQATATA